MSLRSTLAGAAMPSTVMSDATVPWEARKNIWSSKASDESGHPWLNTPAALAPVLVVDLSASFVVMMLIARSPFLLKMVLHGAGHYPACWLARPHPLLAAEPQAATAAPVFRTSAVTSAEYVQFELSNSFGASDSPIEPLNGRNARSHQASRQTIDDGIGGTSVSAEQLRCLTSRS